MKFTSVNLLDELAKPEFSSLLSAFHERRFPKNSINKERNNMYRRPELFLLLCPHAGGDIRIPGKQDFFSKKILPRPENLIYFSAHGRRKAPIF